MYWKYLSVFGEYAKSIRNMENMANLGFFAVQKIASKYAESFLMHTENTLIYAYMKKTQRDS